MLLERTKQLLPELFLLNNATKALINREPVWSLRETRIPDYISRTFIFLCLSNDFPTQGNERNVFVSFESLVPKAHTWSFLRSCLICRILPLWCHLRFFVCFIVNETLHSFNFSDDFAFLFVEFRFLRLHRSKKMKICRCIIIHFFTGFMLTQWKI